MKSYFNSVGFERWNRIYGTTDDINSVRPAASHVMSALLSLGAAVACRQVEAAMRTKVTMCTVSRGKGPVLLK